MQDKNQNNNLDGRSPFLRYILMMLSVFLPIYLFGSDTTDNNTSNTKKFIIGVYKTANIVTADATDDYLYEDVCDRYSREVSYLELQYSNALIRYNFDLDQLKNVENETTEHGKNANDLRKIKVVLDYNLKRLILIEQLKDLNERHSKIRSQLKGRKRACYDIDEFIEKLAKAKKVEMQRVVKTKKTTGCEIKSMTTKDTAKIKMILKLLKDLDLKYDPEYKWEKGSHADLTIDDCSYIMIDDHIIRCFAKRYTHDNKKSYEICDQIQKILESNKGDYDATYNKKPQHPHSPSEIRMIIDDIKKKGSEYQLKSKARCQSHNVVIEEKPMTNFPPCQESLPKVDL